MEHLRKLYFPAERDNGLLSGSQPANNFIYFGRCFLILPHTFKPVPIFNQFGFALFGIGTIKKRSNRQVALMRILARAASAMRFSFSLLTKS